MVSKVIMILWVIAQFVWITNAITTPNCLANHNSSKTILWRREKNDNSSTELPRPRVGGFNNDLEANINKQINLELFAHYTYLSMAYHFDRDDNNLPGFHKFFTKMAEEEHEHARKFMKYQNKRGGRICLRSIQEPCHDEAWGNGTNAMRKALELEKHVNKKLIKLHDDASDLQFRDFLETNFLSEQVDSIKQLSDYVNILQRLGSSPLGEYQFDKLTLQKDS